jgi:hypothetical protein
MVLTLVAALVLVGGEAPAKRRDDPCTVTSKAARKACRAEAIDDYWIAVAVCTNHSDDATRAGCLDEAKATLKEESKDCGDQFEAREDLCEALGGGRYDPILDPAHFLSPAATAANPNPYLPLVPGATRVYRGDGERITVTVTPDTKTVGGIVAMVVRDVVVTDPGGALIEDTLDYFAQDVDGNVWYLGELSQSFENGELSSLDGSWRAGVDGAKPGIVMKAAPMVGDTYRQEFAIGDAEDAGEVISTTGSETVPAASCEGNCVITRDFTPIEPDAEENKYYKAGVGLILEVNVEDGGRVELVSMTP